MFSMWRSSRKMLIVGAFALAALAGPVAAASADDSLTVTPSANPSQGVAGSVKVTGTASSAGTLFVYVEPFGSACGATIAAETDEDVHPGPAVAIGTPGDAVAAGPIDVVLPWTPDLAVTHRICGYLLDDTPDPAEPPLATATASIVVSLPDADADGVPDDTDDCRLVAGPQSNNGCPVPSTPQTPTTTTTTVTPVVPGGITPVVNPPATTNDPTGVLKLKSSKGKATSCGTGCLVRTRTVGPFSFSIKVQVKGAKTKGTGSVTLTRKSAQAGTSGRVCLGRYTAKTGQVCKTVKWTVGKKITVSGSITTPSAIGKSGRPGFGVTAYVGQVFVGSGASVYLKSAGGKVKPDTNESACAASAGAHAAC